jgi:uncharacterized protein YjbI with pentapeptide repeats
MIAAVFCERRIRAAIESSAIIDLSVGGRRKRVRATEVQRWLQAAERGRLRLAGARIVGTLTLAQQGIAAGITFQDCELPDGIDVSGATLRSLSANDCSVGFLNANGVDVAGDIDLSRSHLSGTYMTTASTSVGSALWLCEARIGGRLLCRDASFNAPGQRAIQADRLRVAGTVRFIGNFTARGQIRMIGAQIEGSVDLSGAQLTDPYKGVTLDMADARIDGTLFMVAHDSRCPSFDGRVDLSRATIGGRLHIANATFYPPKTSDVIKYDHIDLLKRCAINARGLSVGGGLTMSTVTVFGGIDLSQGTLGSLHVDRTCTLRSPNEIVIDLANSVVRSVLVIEGATSTQGTPPKAYDNSRSQQPTPTIEGTLRLRDARIEGALILQRTQWSKPRIIEQRNVSRNNLLLAQGLSVLGDVNLTDAQFDGGGLNFRLARLTTFDAAGARIDNRTGEYALNMNGAVIQGNLRLCDGFNSAGLVRIDRAQITGMLTLEQAKLEPGGDGPTLTAYEAGVAAGLRLLWSHVKGHVDLSGLRTSRFTDDPEKWPGGFSLSGMQYTELGDEAAPRGGGDVKKRLKWLRGQTPFDIGPYQQLASVYSRYGHRRQAQKILIAGRNRGRRTDVASSSEVPTRLTRRLARWLIAPFELATGHGYRPQRAATVLALLIATAFLIVSIPSNQLLLRTSDERGNVYTPSGALDSKSEDPASKPCGDGAVRCFQPAAFAVETVLPLISFSQTSTWYVGEDSTQGRILRAALSVLTALGWLVSSIFVLSFARVLRE